MPDLPGAGWHRDRDLRRQRRHRPRQLHLRQLARRREAPVRAGAFRGEPEKGIDTSFDNTFADNRMGVRPDGVRDPNGNDFWWDEEGSGNCWSGKVGAGGGAPSSNVLTGLPSCPGSSVFSPGVPTRTASQATCATWDAYENPDPPACDWFTRPEEPR